ncbi:MAG: hypothetical protein GF353_07375 [Candidatus Lokiarchaeota archaeon]|nr:hypothetical protein [Candidatus Lokiarchaeota archaeon]
MKKMTIAILVLMGMTASIAFASFASDKFSDIFEGDWYEEAIDYLSWRGLVSGYQDGTFKPVNTVNRAENAQMIKNTLEYLEVASRPREIVEAYVEATLTTPSNYESAKQYLGSDILVDFENDSGFVPKSYGIQDIPNYTIVKYPIMTVENPNLPVVEVIGVYDSSEKTWKFDLSREGGKWKIMNYQ